VRSGPGKNEQEPKKKKYNGQQQKEMDCLEPHPAPNEKMQPIQWTERPTGALVAVNSLWPFHPTLVSHFFQQRQCLFTPPQCNEGPLSNSFV